MLLNSAVGPAPPPARAADSGVGSPRSPPPLLHSAQRPGGEGRAWLFLAGPRARARRVRGRPDSAECGGGGGGVAILDSARPRLVTGDAGPGSAQGVGKHKEVKYLTKSHQGMSPGSLASEPTFLSVPIASLMLIHLVLLWTDGNHRAFLPHVLS
ncbi:homeobox protein Hox-D9-like [Bubalus bubalis]|uniref:homeobox protein Hox-D9-like n=1 Tax=Bubalus bubalis TaxID=89462 RepID=UPI001D0FAC9A|nr:homeobox protein Hox-D9-like [Bubalus bubalis]